MEEVGGRTALSCALPVLYTYMIREPLYQFAGGGGGGGGGGGVNSVTLWFI